MSKEWDAILALAEDYNPTSPVYISPLSLAIFGYSLKWLQSRWAWRDERDYLDEVTDSEWDEIEAGVAKLTKEIWGNMIGHIVTLATEEIPDNMLLCDGATYNRVDYPELFSVIADSLKLDADTFNVPDLIVRLPIGGTPDAVGAEGGGEGITLAIDHLPAHSHAANVTDLGHSHVIVGIAALTAALYGEIPAFVGQPSLGATETAFTGISVDIGNTGEGEEISVPYPPVTGVVFAIVAF